MANYVKNSELVEEIIKSKEQGELTPRALVMIQRMIKEFFKTMSYKYPQDREDVHQEALYNVLRNWHRFKPEKSTNAFSYFTQVLKTGGAKGMRDLHPMKEAERVSIGDESGMFNL